MSTSPPLINVLQLHKSGSCSSDAMPHNLTKMNSTLKANSLTSRSNPSMPWISILPSSITSFQPSWHNSHKINAKMIPRSIGISFVLLKQPIYSMKTRKNSLPSQTKPGYLSPKINSLQKLIHITTHIFKVNNWSMILTHTSKKCPKLSLHEPTIPIQVSKPSMLTLVHNSDHHTLIHRDH